MEFVGVLMFLVAGALVVGAGLFVSSLVRPGEAHR